MMIARLSEPSWSSALLESEPRGELPALLSMPPGSMQKLAGASGQYQALYPDLA